MGIINVYGKGGSTHGKHSSTLNMPSQYIDRRKKENAAYRSSKVTKGQLVTEDDSSYIIYSDGRKVKVDIK